MSRRLFPKLTNHKLETVYRHLCGDLPHDVHRHRALDDARLTARMWMKIIAEELLKQVEGLNSALFSSPTLPIA